MRRWTLAPIFTRWGARCMRCWPAPARFSGDPQTVLRQHLLSRRRPCPPVRPASQPELDALVQQLLRKEPDQRPADAVEVRTGWRRWPRTLVVAGTPEPQVRLTAVPSVAAPQVTRPPLAEGFRNCLRGRGCWPLPACCSW